MIGQVTQSDQVFIGIDPGKSGAIAVFRPRSGRLDVFDMPTVTVTRNTKERTELSPTMLANLMNDFSYFSPTPRVVIERVSAMPGQGVSSMFDFGFSTGVVHGVCAALCFPVTIISPKLWQSAARVRDGKDGARLRAMEVEDSDPEVIRLAREAKSRNQR